MPTVQSAEAFWQTADLENRRNKYFSDLLPLFTQIKNTAQEVISINQDAMVKADRRCSRSEWSLYTIHDRRERAWYRGGDLSCCAPAKGNSQPDPGTHGRFQGAW